MYSFKEHYEEIEDKVLNVKFATGENVVGAFIGITPASDADTEYDELQLYTGVPRTIFACYEDEVVDIEVLGEI